MDLERENKNQDCMKEPANSSVAAAELGENIPPQGRTKADMCTLDLQLP